MEIIDTPFQGLFILQQGAFNDIRGKFVKTIHDKIFIDAGLEFEFRESFYSLSKKNVIRGMHFQMPPQDHDKLVYVITGKILDVVLDIRKYSKTFGQYFAIELSDENTKAIYIPKGFAHGFLSLEDDSIVSYHTTTAQDKDCESGILWNSFDFNWPIKNPILSERDKKMAVFSKDINYFI